MHINALSINIMKVYIKRNTWQVEVSYCLLYSHLLLRCDGFDHR